MPQVSRTYRQLYSPQPAAARSSPAPLTGSGFEAYTNLGAGTVTAGGNDAPIAGTPETLTVNVTSPFPVAQLTMSPPSFWYAEDQSLPGELFLVQTSPGGTGGAQSFTVTRGADGTAPVVHQPGFPLVQVLGHNSFAGFQRPGHYNVLLYGADPSGVTDSQPAFAAAYAAMPPSGGVIDAYGAAFRFNDTLRIAMGPPNSQQTVRIEGLGWLGTTIYSYVTGDCIRMFQPTPIIGGGSFRQSDQSGVTQLSIDGTNAGPGSAGLHIGDILAMRLDLSIQNFAQPGSIGLHLDNASNSTEQADVRAQLYNNTQHVVFEVTTGWPSFGYGNFDFSIYTPSTNFVAQDGVVLKNGAQLFHGKLRIRGDLGGQASATTAAVLRLTGKSPNGNPQSGSTSALWASHVDIQVENTVAGAHNPYTIYIDTGCYISGCYGILDFTPGNFQPSNQVVLTTQNPYQFAQFIGPINGDANLNPAATYPQVAWPIVYQGNVPTLSAPFLQLQSYQADFFAYTLTQNTTMNPYGSAGGLTVSGPQRKVYVITQAASGGPYAITWPTPGTPALNTPQINWAGGRVPVMSQAANAVDVYVLWTYDAIHWYGHAVQQENLDVTEQILVQNSAYTLTSQATVQQLFNASTNGALHVQPGTYEFECRFNLTALAATGTFSFSLAGTATVSACTYTAIAGMAASAGAVVAAEIVGGLSTAATVLVVTGAGTTGYAYLKGTLRVTAAGTIIPSITLSVAAAAIVGAGSSFELVPVSVSATAVTVGDWT